MELKPFSFEQCLLQKKCQCVSPEIDITVPGHPIHSNWTVHTADVGKQLGYKVQAGTESRAESP